MKVGYANRAKLQRILDGDGAQANGINELENGGVGADAEREGKYGDDGKAWAEAKQAKGVAKFAQEIGHGSPYG